MNELNFDKKIWKCDIISVRTTRVKKIQKLSNLRQLRSPINIINEIFLLNILNITEASQVFDLSIIKISEFKIQIRSDICISVCISYWNFLQKSISVAFNVALTFHYGLIYPILLIFIMDFLNQILFLDLWSYFFLFYCIIHLLIVIATTGKLSKDSRIFTYATQSTHRGSLEIQ